MEKHPLLFPVSCIEGIGNNYSKELNELGISRIADLIVQPLSKISSSNIPIKMIEKWISHAWLITVPETNFDLVECMVDSGITTIKQIGEKTLKKIELSIIDQAKKGKIKSLPSVYDLAEIQKNAIRYEKHGFVYGKVVNKTDLRPLHQTTVYINDRQETTDEHGYFAFAGLEPGSYKARVVKDGHFSVLLELVIPENGFFHLKSLGLAPKKVLSKEILEGPFKFETGFSNIVEVHEIAKNQIGNNWSFVVDRIYADSSLGLTKIGRTKIGNRIVTHRIRLRESIHEDVSLGQIILFKDNQFQKITGDRRKYHLELLKRLGYKIKN
ncbi:MAG: carboxypeptidase regulatory-like domain-containing protein [Bacteroidetes bacterium]|nr:MAG: carboxypeptidase regulatory-like domain-containing protein [Bacteroidota bacterium]